MGAARVVPGGFDFPSLRPMLVRTAHPSDRDAIEALLDRRQRTDGHPAVSEHKAIRLLSPEQIGRVVIEDGNGEPGLVGYAVANRHPPAAGLPNGHWAVEIVAEPDHDDEVAIVRLLTDTMADGIRDDAPLTLWVWRRAETAAVSPRRLGRRRILAEMARQLPVGTEWSLPDGIELRTFRPGDGPAWIEANNAAFAGHPENGALDEDNLARRVQQRWFDPQGFLLAWDGDKLVGFCWTKVHDATRGEIYIIGIVPDAQGQGLGRALLLAGLADLHQRRGVTEAVLYTDADDNRAVSMYRSLGFETIRMLEELVLRA